MYDGLHAINTCEDTITGIPSVNRNGLPISAMDGPGRLRTWPFNTVQNEASVQCSVIACCFPLLKLRILWRLGILFMKQFTVFRNFMMMQQNWNSRAARSRTDCALLFVYNPDQYGRPFAPKCQHRASAWAALKPNQRDLRWPAWLEATQK